MCLKNTTNLTILLLEKWRTCLEESDLPQVDRVKEVFTLYTNLKSLIVFVTDSTWAAFHCQWGSGNEPVFSMFPISGIHWSPACWAGRSWGCFSSRHEWGWVGRELPVPLCPSVLVPAGALGLLPLEAQASICRETQSTTTHWPRSKKRHGGEKQDLQETGLSHPGFRALAEIWLFHPWAQAWNELGS